VFAATQLVLAGAAETARPELRDPHFGVRRARLRARLGERAGRPWVLAVGSSRVELGLRPGELGLSDDGPWVFNFGQPGAGPLHEWLVWRRLCDSGARPARLLVEVLPAALCVDGPADGGVAPERLAWADLTDVLPYCAAQARVAGGWLAARAAPAYSARFCLTSLLVPFWLPVANRVDYIWTDLDGDGVAVFPPALADPTARQRGRDQAAEDYGRRLRQFHIGRLSDQLLRRLLDDCRRADTPALLVLMPESPAFRDLYPPDALRTLAAYLDGLTAEYAVPVLDARTWVGEDGFWDGHHLLPAGAVAFSRRLGREARPFLRAASQ
jgi:hypothetical protein